MVKIYVACKRSLRNSVYAECSWKSTRGVVIFTDQIRVNQFWVWPRSGQNGFCAIACYYRWSRSFLRHFFFFFFFFCSNSFVNNNGDKSCLMLFFISTGNRKTRRLWQHFNSFIRRYVIQVGARNRVSIACSLRPNHRY